MTGPDDGERDRPPSWGWALALGLVAALPAALAGWRVVRWGWVPVGDHGLIATRAYDVLTSRSPQLGQASTVTGDGPLARSPGPMGYWVIALPARLGPLWAPAVTAAAVAVASTVGSVVLAWRRAGPAFAALVAVGLVVVARAIDPVHLAAIWNPSLGLAPMVLLFFLGWSVGVGERRLFPALALVGSLLGQVHLGVAVPAAGVVALATAAGFAGPALAWGRGRRSGSARPAGDQGPEAGLAAERRGRRSGSARPAEVPSGTTGHSPAAVRPGDAGDTDRATVDGSAGSVDAPRGGAGRWFLAGLAVFGVCWALPAFQQLTNRPGNLQVLLGSSGEVPSTMGWGPAARFVAGAVGLVPRFLGPVETPFEVVAGVPGSWSSLAVLSAGALLLVLVALAALAARRRDRSTPVAAGLLVAMGLGAWAAAAQTPDDLRILTISYSLRWLVAWGLLVWLVAGLAGVRAVVEARAPGADAHQAGQGRSRSRTVALPPWVGPAGLVAAMAVAVVVAVATPTDDFERSLYRPFDRLGDAVVAEVEPGRPYLVDAVGLLEGEVAPAMTYRIRRAGGAPVLAGAVGEATGTAYVPTGARCAAVFTFLPGRAGAPIPPGGRVLVAVTTPANSAIQVDGVTAVLRPDDGPPSC
ncbi:MAG TPA: hypothetical protein VEW93_09070 [Acidimicrobiales bacterium]|nr:hypothetical protein [Acidimicrobiales bacterium]